MNGSLNDTQNDKKENALLRIKNISDRFFLTEPLLFSVLCTHSLSENKNLHIPFRTGRGKIEYSPKILDSLSDAEIQEWLCAELFRILLKHPYQRVPLYPDKNMLSVASDITVSQMKKFFVPITNALDLQMKDGLSFEEYYSQLKNRRNYAVNNLSASLCDFGLEAESKDKNDDSNSDTDELEEFLTRTSQKSALWEEDEEMCEKVNVQIQKAVQTKQWGSIPANAIEMIEASLVIKINYKSILLKFRQSVISEKRILTRMKPNRRYDFDCMGSRYAFTTKLLVAVDVSGSVSSVELQRFFSVINRFFKYGIKSIDVIQFDCELKYKNPVSLKKTAKTVKVVGRGGTDFQVPVDFYESRRKYDGLIICTDGYAPYPIRKTKRKILWMLTDESSFRQNDWIKNQDASSVVWIP